MAVPKKKRLSLLKGRWRSISALNAATRLTRSVSSYRALTSFSVRIAALLPKYALIGKLPLISRDIDNHLAGVCIWAFSANELIRVRSNALAFSTSGGAPELSKLTLSSLILSALPQLNRQNYKLNILKYTLFLHTVSHFINEGGPRQKSPNTLNQFYSLASCGDVKTLPAVEKLYSKLLKLLIVKPLPVRRELEVFNVTGDRYALLRQSLLNLSQRCENLYIILSSMELEDGLLKDGVLLLSSFRDFLSGRRRVRKILISRNKNALWTASTAYSRYQQSLRRASRTQLPESGFISQVRNAADLNSLSIIQRTRKSENVIIRWLLNLKAGYKNHEIPRLYAKKQLGYSWQLIRLTQWLCKHQPRCKTAGSCTALIAWFTPRSLVSSVRVNRLNNKNTLINLHWFSQITLLKRLISLLRTYALKVSKLYDAHLTTFITDPFEEKPFLISSLCTDLKQPFKKTSPTVKKLEELDVAAGRRTRVDSFLADLIKKPTPQMLKFKKVLDRILLAKASVDETILKYQTMAANNTAQVKNINLQNLTTFSAKTNSLNTVTISLSRALTGVKAYLALNKARAARLENLTYTEIFYKNPTVRLVYFDKPSAPLVTSLSSNVSCLRAKDYRRAVLSCAANSLKETLASSPARNAHIPLSVKLSQLQIRQTLHGVPSVNNATPYQASLDLAIFLHSGARKILARVVSFNLRQRVDAFNYKALNALQFKSNKSFAVTTRLHDVGFKVSKQLRADYLNPTPAAAQPKNELHQKWYKKRLNLSNAIFIIMTFLSVNMHTIFIFHKTARSHFVKFILRKPFTQPINAEEVPIEWLLSLQFIDPAIFYVYDWKSSLQNKIQRLVDRVPYLFTFKAYSENVFFIYSYIRRLTLRDVIVKSQIVPFFKALISLSSKVFQPILKPVIRHSLVALPHLADPFPVDHTHVKADLSVKLRTFGVVTRVKRVFRLKIRQHLFLKLRLLVKNISRQPQIMLSANVVNFEGKLAKFKRLKKQTALRRKTRLTKRLKAKKLKLYAGIFPRFKKMLKKIKFKKITITPLTDSLFKLYKFSYLVRLTRAQISLKRTYSKKNMRLINLTAKLRSVHFKAAHSGKKLRQYRLFLLKLRNHLRTDLKLINPRTSAKSANLTKSTSRSTGSCSIVNLKYYHFKGLTCYKRFKANRTPLRDCARHTPARYQKRLGLSRNNKVFNRRLRLVNDTLRLLCLAKSSSLSTES